MGQELQLPDWAKKGAAPAFASLDAQGDNVADGIGQSYGVIGYKGKQWSIRARGTRHNVLDAQGFGSPFLDVIILGQAKTKSKSYYKKFDPNTSDGDRPICSSIDGIVPDADATHQECESCALCPRNVWKTDPQTGRKGRECTDYKRLAVLVLPTQTKPIFGEPMMEPLFLRVPPDSLNALAIMGETMASQGFHYSSYITRITFDPNKAHPCMVFRPLQGLSDQEAPVILDLRQDALVGRITGGDLATGTAAPTPAQSIAPPGTAATGLIAPAATQPQPPATSQGGGGNPQLPGSSASATTQAASKTPDTSSKESTGGAPAATQNTIPQGQSASATSETSTGLVDTGFGGASTATLQPAQEQTAPLAAVDSGSPEESDAALDARIAKLIGA